MSLLNVNFRHTVPRAPGWNWLTRLGLSLAVAGALTFAPSPRPALALPQTLVVDRADDVAGLPCLVADSNDCSLRSAVNLANTDASLTDITFSSNFTITLGSTLMLTVTGTTILATPGQVVEINANNTGQAFHISASDNTLQGLRLYGSSLGTAIVWISGSAQRVRLANNVIGDDDLGFLGACGNSPNSHSGIYIGSDASPVGSDALAWIYGNHIKCVAGFPGHGIQIDGSREVVIGANSAGQAGPAHRNFILLNAGDAVHLSPASNFNVIRNSFLQYSDGSGLVIDGGDSNQAYGNHLQHNDQYGLLLTGGASLNSIGCPLFAGDPNDEALRNVIHNNTSDGIVITGTGTNSNLILCNWIGLSDDGNGSASNGGNGVRIDGGAAFNIIGVGPTTFNVISGNDLSGVLITGSGTRSNLVQGNYIGANAAGTGVVGNGWDGVTLTNGAVQNTIGGNHEHGVFISGSSTATNTVAFNHIGLNSAGIDIPLPNGENGIHLSSNTHGNLIGGPASANYVAYNGGAGVAAQSGANANQLLRNLVFSNTTSGVILAGAGTILNVLSELSAYNNGGDGIAERGGATANVWNVISTYGNGGLGIDKAAGATTNIPTAPYPVITSVNVGTGQINGVANNNATVELYRAAPDPSGFGEGRTFLGSTVANGAGAWSLNVGPGLANCYTAFQTLAGVSSEFGPHTCLTVFLPLILR